jgi:hypothetical protein
VADRVQWGGGRRKACADFIHYELDRARTQRAPLERDWRKWLTQYRAKADRGVAHFPFEGASNLTYPVTAMTVDPIWARFMQNIHAAPNMWTLRALNERWLNVAKPLQDYLQWLDMFMLKMWDVNMRVLPEAIKLGTSLYKTSWLYQRKRTIGYDANKQRIRKIEIVNRPSVDHVSIANFVVPPEARSTDPDEQGGAQWVAERHRLRPAQLKAMAKGQEPFLPNFDPAAVTEVLKYYEIAPPDHEQTIRGLDDLDMTYSNMVESKPIEIWEVHIRYDSTGNGIEDDLVLFWHQESQQMLRATYEDIIGRPYTPVHYLRGDGFYGVGVGEQTEMWQESMSNIWNYNIDKILLTNAPMIRAREGANILPNEPIFPTKVWFGDKDDIEPFWLTSNASFDINALLSFMQDGVNRHVGLSDLQMGTISGLPSRTPATTIQSLLAEGNTKFDMSMKDVRQALSQVGLKVLQVLQIQVGDRINNPEGGIYGIELPQMILGSPEGEHVAQALNVPLESVELGIGVDLTATSSVNNKEIMRQSNLALLQLFGQIGPQFLELANLAQQGAGTPLGEVAVNLLDGLRELSYRVLEQFDVRNPEEVLPNVSSLFQAQGAMAAGQPIAPLAGAGPPQGAPGVQGF